MTQEEHKSVGELKVGDMVIIDCNAFDEQIETMGCSTNFYTISELHKTNPWAKVKEPIILIDTEGNERKDDDWINVSHLKKLPHLSTSKQETPEESLDSVIKYLTSYGHDKLHCPRCGWVEGKTWHCGLCEGHTQNIIDWYATHLSNKSEKEVSGLEEAK